MDSSSFRTQFEVYASQRLERYLTRMGKVTSQPVVHSLAEATAKLFQGGKRLRPTLVYLAYTTVNGRDEELMFALSFAVELFHFFCLVHDDIIDASPTRHGVATLHTQFGTDQALLMGDMLASWAVESLEEAVVGLLNEDVHKLLSQFATLREEVIVGQMLDVAITAQSSLEDIMEKTYLKTARYSFVHPIILGAQAAGASLSEFAEAFGRPLGTAFQLQDDLIDEEAAGTYLGYVWSHDKLSLRQATREVKKKIQQLFTQATQALVVLPHEQQEPWHTFVEVLRRRKV